MNVTFMGYRHNYYSWCCSPIWLMISCMGLSTIIILDLYRWFLSAKYQYPFLVLWTRPSFLQRLMYCVIGTRIEGLGALAIRPWHAGMQSHDIVTRQNALNTTGMRVIQICACVLCVHIPSPAPNMSPCGELDGSYVTAAIWLTLHTFL